MLATEQSMIKEKNQKEIRKYLERNENGTKNCRMWQKIGGKKVKVKVPQLCLILCDLMDCIAHGILQARILKWVAFPFSRGSPQPRDRTQVSCIAGGFIKILATRKPKSTGVPSLSLSRGFS